MIEAIAACYLCFGAALAIQGLAKHGMKWQRIPYLVLLWPIPLTLFLMDARGQPNE